MARSKFLLNNHKLRCIPISTLQWGGKPSLTDTAGMVSQDPDDPLKLPMLEINNSGGDVEGLCPSPLH